MLANRNGFVLPSKNELQQIIKQQQSFKEQCDTAAVTYKEALKGFNVNCMQRGVTFMNRCGPKTRHRTLLKNGKLVFLKHSTHADLEATEATAALSSLAGGSSKEATGCGKVRRLWSERIHWKLPEPMQSWHALLTGDDISVIGYRLLRKLKKRMPKASHSLHHPAALCIGMNNQSFIDYVFFRLSCFGISTKAIYTPISYDADKYTTGTCKVYLQHLVPALAREDVATLQGVSFGVYRISHPVLDGDCWYFTYNGVSQALNRCSSTSEVCLDCKIESFVAYLLGAAACEGYKRKKDSMTLRALQAVQDYIEPEKTKLALTCSSTLVSSQDRNNTNHRYAARTYSLDYTRNACDSSLESTIARYVKPVVYNSTRVSFTIPIGNKGALNYSVSRIEKLIKQLQKMHPEIRTGDDYASPKLEEFCPSIE